MHRHSTDMTTVTTPLLTVTDMKQMLQSCVFEMKSGVMFRFFTLDGKWKRAAITAYFPYPTGIVDPNAEFVLSAGKLSGPDIVFEFTVDEGWSNVAVSVIDRNGNIADSGTAQIPRDKIATFLLMLSTDDIVPMDRSQDCSELKNSKP